MKLWTINLAVAGAAAVIVAPKDLDTTSPCMCWPVPHVVLRGRN